MPRTVAIGAQDFGRIIENNSAKREKSLEDTAHAAIRQMLDKKYAALLKEKGVPEGKIRMYGFAFQGKEVLIKGGYLTSVET